MTGVEGAITLHLRTAEARVERVDVTSTRPVNACRALEGRPVEEALRLIPAMYSICGTAQAHAALAAAETALGIAVSEPQRAARRFLLLGETLGEHVWRMLMDWPPLADGEAAVMDLARVRRPLGWLASALYPDGDWNKPGGGRLVPDREALSEVLDAVSDALDDLVFGPEGGAIRDLAQLRGWAAQGASAPARFVAALLDEGLAEVGASAVAPLPDPAPESLAKRLADDRDGGFAARPDLEGDVHHTGPLARRWETSLVADIRSRLGAGVLAWVAARLDELAGVVGEMRGLTAALAEDPGGGTVEGDGIGLGVVEAARGRLVHRLEAEDGRVARYQILAPTEWNFHPEGVLVQGLNGVPAAECEHLARLFVSAVDPCVTCVIEAA